VHAHTGNNGWPQRW